jgi:hypothetical protein
VAHSLLAAKNFIACDREQELLLPPSLKEWLPEDHLAWFVLATIEEMDLSAFYGAYRGDGHGRAAHEPGMMLALVLYAYCKGQRSSRVIERERIIRVVPWCGAGGVKEDTEPRAGVCLTTRRRWARRLSAHHLGAHPAHADDPQLPPLWPRLPEGSDQCVDLHGPLAVGVEQGAVREACAVDEQLDRGFGALVEFDHGAGRQF